jgi:hypothetical protein
MDRYLLDLKKKKISDFYLLAAHGSEDSPFDQL